MFTSLVGHIACTPHHRHLLANDDDAEVSCVAASRIRCFRDAHTVYMYRRLKREIVRERLPVTKLTFRTLFWNSEAILPEPPAESRGRAIHG